MLLRRLALSGGGGAASVTSAAPRLTAMQPSGVEVQQLGAVAICGAGGHGACTRVCLSKQGGVVSGTADGTLQVCAPDLQTATRRVSRF